MSFTVGSALVPDRDSLPLKKRDKVSCHWQPPQKQQPCDGSNFKAPYPYRCNAEVKTKHGLFRPVPRRVTPLYEPWIHTEGPSRPLRHPISFREHRGWAEWRDFSPLPAGWDFSQHFQQQSRPSGARALYPGYAHCAPKLGAGSGLAEGFQVARGGWERLKLFRDKGFSPVRHKGPQERKGERKPEDLFWRERGRKLPPPPSCEDDGLKQHFPHKTFPPGIQNTTGLSKSRTSAQAATPHDSTSPNHFPWLLPHFLAGSLIELRDGRLRRVEHLQTEDFLLGSLACPDLRLSCCTVQSISPSAAASSVSRILVLLHDQQSQELVDVYVEYPFFVRGHGWSSCSPQRTAHLCGLQCRQLSVGDVCLALTPVSASATKSEATCEPTKAHRALCIQAHPGRKQPEPGQKSVAEASRRRHCSAP